MAAIATISALDPARGNATPPDRLVSDVTEPRIPRTRAPELVGRGWLNTDGPLRLADLRGRFVLLDFWTFCCINCLHVIDELRPLEEAHAEELVVIGVHSPKFLHEADPEALAQAVRRHRVDHPVLDDPDLRTWQAYTARAWPTLVLIDPEGYVIAQYAGEGHAHAIDALITDLAPSYAISSSAPRRAMARAEALDLAFPAKAVRLPDGTLLVADAGNDRLARFESSAPQRDGARPEALDLGLREPNGLCLLPPGFEYDVVVADTGNHRLAGWNSQGPASEAVTLASGLNSPWDVTWWRGRVWVAMAGDHTLHAFDPCTGVSERVGGTTNEGLVDGPLAEAWFAQPSGLAPDGDRLWLADAETSALRWVEDAPDGLSVHTAIGEGLFDFGFRDGDRSVARMQHPLGVTVYDGKVLVADTYNGAIRSYDPETGMLSTIAQGLAEPSGFVPSSVEPVQTGLLVVESAAHRLTPLVAEEEVVEGPVSQTRRPPTDLAATATLRVSFTAPPGQKVDERFGPAVQLHVSATPAALLREGAGVDSALERRLVLDSRVGEGVLHIAARAATCDIEGGEGAACRLHQQDWGIPVTVGEAGEAELVLPLGGLS